MLASFSDDATARVADTQGRKWMREGGRRGGRENGDEMEVRIITDCLLFSMLCFYAFSHSPGSVCSHTQLCPSFRVEIGLSSSPPPYRPSKRRQLNAKKTTPSLPRRNNECVCSMGVFPADESSEGLPCGVMICNNDVTSRHFTRKNLFRQREEEEGGIW